MRRRCDAATINGRTGRDGTSLAGPNRRSRHATRIAFSTVASRSVLEQLQTRLVRPLLWRDPTEPTPTVERLRAAVADDAVLHGTRQGNLDRIDARMQTDYFGRRVHGVFATRDHIWPIFYAVVDRTSAGSMRCQCLKGRSGTRYLFSTEGDPRWAAGNVYVLQGDGFETRRWNR
jgi:hypothetical protein